ncbi:MAG: hypothetical protein ACREC6_10035 [Hyphomicrobiaceae bacterium]
MLLERWTGVGGVVFRLATAMLLALAALFAVIDLRPTGGSAPPLPSGNVRCRETDEWCKRLVALQSADKRKALRDLNKLSEVLPHMRPTGDVYAMRAGNHLQRQETGPLVLKDDFAAMRRQFVTAVLTYDLPARLARLGAIETQARDPTVRHRALLEIASSIVRADDRVRYPEARAALDRALVLPIPVKQANSDVYFLLARLARTASRFQEAFDALDKAIELDGYFFHAHLDRLRLILTMEDTATPQQRAAAIGAAVQTGDAVALLEDRGYLLELQQALARHAQRRSLIRPFVEAYVGVVREDGKVVSAAIRAFDEACRAAGRDCPRDLQARVEGLRKLTNPAIK